MLSLLVDMLIFFILSMVFSPFGLIYLKSKKVIFEIDEYFKLCFIPIINTVLAVVGLFFIIPWLFKNFKEVYFMVRNLIREIIEMYKFNKNNKSDE
jgi:uncharacterized membrane protein YqjE